MEQELRERRDSILTLIGFLLLTFMITAAMVMHGSGQSLKRDFATFIDFFDITGSVLFVEGPRHIFESIGLPGWLIAFLADGIGGGVQLVGTFIPVIGALFLDGGLELARRFVLDHLACPPIDSGDLSAWGRALLRLARLPNVSAKLSGLVTEADWPSRYLIIEAAQRSIN